VTVGADEKTHDAVENVQYTDTALMLALENPGPFRTKIPCTIPSPFLVPMLFIPISPRLSCFVFGEEKVLAFETP
jgi:hypothetical protein